MATDVSAIVGNLLAGTGYGRTPADVTQQSQQIQQGNQSLQAGAIQLQALRAQQAQNAQYQSDVADYINDPTPDKIASLAMKYPDKAKPLIDAAKLKDDAHTTADQTFYGQVYGAANNGRTDLVKQQLQSRRDAEAKAGGDTSELDDALQQLNSGDPKALDQIKASVLTQMYAHDPDKFSEVMGLGKDKTHVITAGGALVGDDGKVLYQANDKPQYEKVDVFDATGTKVGERIVQVGGGQGGGSADTGVPRSVRNNNPGNIEDGQFAQSQPGYQGSDGRFAQFASPEAGAAAQTALLSQYGQQGRNTVAKIVSKWAPSSDGNDVGAYAKFVAQKLGVHPNQSLDMTDPKTLSGLQMAMAAFEGGSQSKSNGAGPIGKVAYDSTTQAPPATDSTGAGLTGDAYLQTLPANVATQVKALSEGRLPIPPGFALSKPYWQNLLQKTAQYDQSFDASNAQTRVATRKDFTSGKSAQNITSFNTVLHHIDTLQHAANDLNNWQIPFLNTVGNAALKASGDPRVDRFNSAKQAVVDELERAFRGSTGTLGGIKGWESALSSSSSPDQIHGVLNEMANLLAGRIESLGEQYKSGMGRSIDPVRLLDSKAQTTLRHLADGYQGSADFPTEVTAGPQSSPAAAQAAPGRASLPHVSTKAQAASLPSGTHFIDPHGIERVNP